MAPKNRGGRKGRIPGYLGGDLERYAEPPSPDGPARTRAPQPGRLAPYNQAGVKPGAAANKQPGTQPRAGAGAAAAPRKPATAGETKQQKKMRTLHEAWDEAAPASQAVLAETAGRLLDQFAADSKQHLGEVQQRIEKAERRAWEAHDCRTKSASPAVHTRNMAYFNIQNAGTVRVTTYTCSCKQKVEANALSFGCMPNTPKQPTMLFDIQMLHLAGTLMRSDGLSLTGASLCNTRLTVYLTCLHIQACHPAY